MKSYGVVYRWLTDVSGLGLVEQARRLMHPDPPRKEEELAEHVEMWQDTMRRPEARKRVQIGTGVQDQRAEDFDDREGEGILRPVGMRSGYS